MKRLLAIAAAAVVLGCSAPSCKLVGPVVPDGGDDCAAAEARLDELGGCGLPVKFTADACVRAAKDGRSWRADCLARLKSCDGLDAAYRAKGACP